MITIDSLSCTELNITDEAILKAANIAFYDVRKPPFTIHGLYRPQTEPYFHRLPEDVAQATSAGVYGLQKNTAGGRIRFATTSNYIAFKTDCSQPADRANMCNICSAGFDVYMERSGRDTFMGVFRPPYIIDGGYVGIVYLPGHGLHEITVNFPHYTNVKNVCIGLDSQSELTAHRDYRYAKPVYYYGSSITQGASPSRAGLAYEHIITRRLDCDFYNLGFAGCAKGEDAIADYMASQDYSVFVMDYDHNAPSAEHLQNTHEKLYLKIRAAHPDTPIIIVGKPDYTPNNRQFADRRNVLYTTYKNARSRGEKVIFIDGYSLFAGELREECTMDGCHPNDIGMMRMADVIGKAVEYALSW